MVHVSSIIRSHGTMDTKSKPTFCPLSTPLLFNNMLFCPHLTLFVSLPFHMLSFQLFFCLSAGFVFPLSLHVHA